MNFVKAPGDLYALGLVLPVYDVPAHRHLFLDTGVDYRIEAEPHPELKTPCWVWLKKTLRGYGIVRNGHDNLEFHKNSSRPAHRVYWELMLGPVPTTEDTGCIQGLDHLCKRKECVNPAHLRPLPFNEHGELERNYQRELNGEVPF